MSTSDSSFPHQQPEEEIEQEPRGARVLDFPTDEVSSPGHPVPAGTWADDETGACSATGTGEHILRYDLARTACELLRWGVPAKQAAEAAIAGFGERIAGKGGIILVSPRGDAAVARNTATMSWAVARVGADIELGF